MEFITYINIITIITIIVIMIIPNYEIILIEKISLAYASLTFLVSLGLLLVIPINKNGIVATFTISELTVNISFVLDGIAITYIILTTFLTFVVIMASLNIKTNRKQFYLTILLTQILLINSFITGDIFFFFVLFEIILMPFFFLINGWGSQKERINAATSLVVYTLLGSFSMLAGIIILFQQIGTTNIIVIQNEILDLNIEKIISICFLLAFAFKVPMMPFHIWLPKAHVEAPTAGSALLAGILLKVGSYGYLRFLLFLFPNSSLYFTPLILLLATISMTLSTFAIVRLIDLKRIIAYSSIAHMNYLIAGITVYSLCAEVGSIVLQIAHGLASVGLFFCVGFLYDRYKTRNTYYYRGLNIIMPWLSFFFFVLSLANIGFPSTLNFIAEISILCGLFETVPSIGIIMLFSILIIGIYSFVINTKIIFGRATSYINTYYDLTRRETLSLFNMIAPLLIGGVITLPFTIIFYEELLQLYSTYAVLWSESSRCFVCEEALNELYKGRCFVCEEALNELYKGRCFVCEEALNALALNELNNGVE
jgi:NADH-ubiquinone oxidoreductase chain 4